MQGVGTIPRYAEAPADPGWRISPAAWDGSQVVADVGCGNGFGLRQLVHAQPKLSFTTETGAAVLATGPSTGAACSPAVDW
jgi:hypothetical protein